MFMIQEKKTYLIDGWAILSLLDIVKNLKVQISANYKTFSKEEFLTCLKGYDSTMKYLINLKQIDLNEGTTQEEGMGIHEQYIRNLLSSLNIPVQNGGEDEKS